MIVPATPSPEMLKVFETLPGLYLILSPNLIILTASNAYLQATYTGREKITGRHIFDVFPQKPGGEGIIKVKDSLQQVLSSRKPHQMEPIRYDLSPPLMQVEPVEQYWLSSNTPVLNEAGEIFYIIHHTINITERVKAQVQLTLAQSQTHQAQQEAYLSRQQLHNILMQAPAMICIFEGPNHVFKLVNPPYQTLVGNRPLLGRPIREAMPELEGQPIFCLLDKVYQTGEPFYAYEMKVQLDHANSGELGHNYYNFTYQPIGNSAGDMEGIMVFAYQVTTQVEARRQVENSEQSLQVINKELATSNEELRATTEELVVANDELYLTQKQLQEMNEGLESLVAERTQALQAALKQNEQHRIQLLEQHGFLEAILGQVPASIATLIGPQHRYSYFNSNYQLLSGDRTRLGQTVAEVFPEVIEQGFIGLLDEVYASGKPFIGRETPAMLYDPTTNKPEQRYVDFIYQPLFSEQGETQGILAFIVDVTEKVLARKKIEESEQRFGNLANNITQLAWMADEQGWIYWYNKRWYEYTGSDFEEMQGWGWEKVHHPAYIDSVVEFVRKAWQKNQTWELEFPLRKVDGTYGWFLTRAVPLVDEGGKITGWFGTNTDISEQKRVQQHLQTLNDQLASTTEELRAANEEIQAANEELSIANDQLLRTNVDLDNFIYTASHDLKAPISNIEALLTALLRTLPPECMKTERAGHITTLMTESIERFKRTIANLTEVIKLQKENNSEMVLVDLSKVIEEVNLDLQPLILQTNTQIEIEVENCPKVRFSEKNLRSVIYNLLSNAIKYHSPGRLPQVSISCQATAAYHVLIVTDNGLGIESGRISQLFTMFKRFHDHVEGTGIGLYMVKKMVENAGGKIEVESRLAAGSTFRVYFPL